MLTTLTTIRTYNCTNDKTLYGISGFPSGSLDFFEIFFLIGGIS